MKVIFLDIDGVLCTMRSHIAFNGNFLMQHLDPVATRMIARLAKETDSKIVLSSTWRIHHEIGAMSAILMNAGWDNVPWHQCWRTPKNFSRPRGEEIAQWFQDHKADRYVIIDDDADMLDEQKPFFVQTNSDEGFGWKEYQKVEQILASR